MQRKQDDIGESVPLQAGAAGRHGGGEVLSRGAFREGRVLRVPGTYNRRYDTIS